MTDLFDTPYLFEGPDFVVVSMDIEGLIKKGSSFSWDAFVAELQSMLDRPARVDEIQFSTKASPSKYSNVFNRKTFELLQRFEAAALVSRAFAEEHAEIEASRPPEVSVPPQYDEDGEIIAPKPKKKKEIRAEKEARAVDLERYQKLLDAQHTVSCLEPRVANVLSLHSIRVPFM